MAHVTNQKYNRNIFLRKGQAVRSYMFDDYVVTPKCHPIRRTCEGGLVNPIAATLNIENFLQASERRDEVR